MAHSADTGVQLIDSLTHLDEIPLLLQPAAVVVLLCTPASQPEVIQAVILVCIHTHGWLQQHFSPRLEVGARPEKSRSTDAPIIIVQDGSTSSESRWSCRPSLDPSGSGCGITYTLEEEQHIENLQIGEVGSKD